MFIFVVGLAKKPRQPKMNGEGNFNAFNKNRFPLEGSDVHFIHALANLGASMSRFEPRVLGEMCKCYLCAMPQ